MELKDSCEARGIKFGLYYSFLDWNHSSQIPHKDWFTNMVSFEARADYIRDMKAQLNELITRYKPAVLWFDGDWTYNSGAPTLSKWWTTTDAIELYDYLMDLDSTLIVNERIIRGFGLGDFDCAEGNVPGEPLSRQWETCRNMNGSWGYNYKKMNNYKTASQLIREMVKTVSRDGNYLLNIGPKGDGTVPSQEIEILNAFGDWMSIYGESIYGTTRSPYSSEPGWGLYTKKPGKIYAHVFYWPSGNQLMIPSPADPVHRIFMLNDKSTALSYVNNGGTITIYLPEDAPNSINSVVRIDLEENGQTGIKENPVLSFQDSPVLEQNYPNPFSSATKISFHLPARSFVSLKIFDSTGREVSSLLSKDLPAGSYQYQWNASDMPGGIYFCHLQVGTSAQIKRSILIK
jgi:alpha-L-fucosidase